jgi:hypothetical protein
MVCISHRERKCKSPSLERADKTKYEIYDALQSAVAKSKNWNDLMKELKKAGITTDFKYNGNITEIQGIKFGKNGYEFSGSKIDRQYSYSKIDYQLQQNNRAQEVNIHHSHPEHSHNQSSTLAAAGSLLGGLLDIPASDSDFDPEQAEWLRQHKKKKKSKGHRL